MNTDKKVQAIHKASMEIVEKTGMILHHDAIVDLVKSHGIRTEGQRVFFTEEQLMFWIKKAPSEFTLYARNPAHNMHIGGDEINFVSATCGFPYISAPEGERDALYPDFVKFLKLNQVAPCFKINGGVMITPNDLSNVDIYPTMLLSTLIYSDKCIFGGMGGKVECEHTMNLLKIAFGEKELLEKPRIVTIISTDSPLKITDNMLDTMISYVNHGQALIVAPAVMAGATGPTTLAGAITVSNVETLVGIAVSQMLKAGTPVIYGSATALTDLRDGSFCIGAAESALAIKYCTKLAKFYELPCRGGGTLTDAKFTNIQAGYEGMMCSLAAATNGMNFMLHSAGQLGSYRSMSFEKYIVDLEIIGMVDRYARDIEVDEENLAVDVIMETGPGGEFLTHEHTYTNFRSSSFITDLAIRGNVDTDESDAIFHANIAKKMNKMLDNYVQPEFDQDVKQKMAAYLKDIGYDVHLD